MSLRTISIALLALLLNGCASWAKLQADFTQQPWQTCSKVATVAGSSAGLALGLPFASSVLIAGVNSSVGCFGLASQMTAETETAVSVVD